MTDLPEITVQALKDAGLKCYQIDFAGPIGSKLHEQGYSFDQVFTAFRKYTYYSQDSGAHCIRLRPSFDPDARPCPTCNDPEIVMQPKDGRWYCPKCKQFAPQATSDQESEG